MGSITQALTEAQTIDLLKAKIGDTFEIVDEWGKPQTVTVVSLNDGRVSISVSMRMEMVAEDILVEFGVKPELVKVDASERKWKL